MPEMVSQRTDFLERLHFHRRYFGKNMEPFCYLLHAAAKKKTRLFQLVIQTLAALLAGTMENEACTWSMILQGGFTRKISLALAQHPGFSLL